LGWVIKLIIWGETAYKEYGTEHYLFKAFSSVFFFRIFRIFRLPCDDGKSRFDRIYTRFYRCSFLYKIVSLFTFLQFSTYVPGQDRIAKIGMSNVGYSLFVVFILFCWLIVRFFVNKRFCFCAKMYFLFNRKAKIVYCT